MTATTVTIKTEAPARRALVFPSRLMVDAAAGLFDRYRVPDRALGLVSVHEGPSVALSRELYPEQFPAGPGRQHAPRVVGSQVDRELVEGPRHFLTLGPGVVTVSSMDPARAERAAQRAACRSSRCGDASHGHPPYVPQDSQHGASSVTSWSAKSRARMVKTIGMLDLAPVVDQPGAPAMLTATYPGDWLTVAPDSEVCRRHVDTFRKRWLRKFGTPLVGIWKREFQRRGAPHYHIWTVPPAVDRAGQEVTSADFREWFSVTWASVVGHPDAEQYRRHVLAGTAVDYATGSKARDPEALGRYFVKHGVLSAKDYQNHAPAEWADHGSVGRFWGYWGLRKAVAVVEVHADDALAAARVLRRHSRANSYVARVPAWKHRSVVDVETGEVRAKWRRGTRRQRVYRMRGSAGFVAAGNAPALAADVARALDKRRAGPPIGRAGSGPVGFLP